MGRSSTFAFAAAALLGAVAPALAAPAPECTLGRLAELPVTMEGTRPLVGVKINGQDALMLIDSGAFFSALTDEFVSSQGAAIRHLPQARLSGADGSTAFRHTTMREFQIGAAKVKNADFVVIPSWPEGRGVGLLGQNLLGIADVEYDLANRVVRLFQPSAGCAGASRAYWAPKAAHSAGLRPIGKLNPHIYVDVEVNGVRLTAMMDTGASASVIGLKAAKRAGLTPEMAGATTADTLFGIALKGVRAWTAPVGVVAIGDETISNTRIRISDADLSDADMVLGADFFLSHRVYIARSQRRLYFSYNGGPVFRLDGA